MVMKNATQSAKSTFVAVYRVGGTQNFKWVPTLPVATRREADQLREEIERGGRPCYVYSLHQYQTIGGPESFDAEQEVGG
jgi:hypothetical protein